MCVGSSFIAFLWFFIVPWVTIFVMLRRAALMPSCDSSLGKHPLFFRGFNPSFQHAHIEIPMCRAILPTCSGTFHAVDLGASGLFEVIILGKFTNQAGLLFNDD
jgi:hypothetical protein